MEPDERDVLEQERRRFQAMVQGDVAALEARLADDLVYTHASGVRETKAQFLAAVRSGDLVYEAFTPEDLRARVFGPAAVVTGAASVKVRARGQDLAFRILFTDVYIRGDRGWQMVAWQATRPPAA